MYDQLRVQLLQNCSRCRRFLSTPKGLRLAHPIRLECDVLVCRWRVGVERSRQRASCEFLRDQGQYCRLLNAYKETYGVSPEYARVPIAVRLPLAKPLVTFIDALPFIFSLRCKTRENASDGDPVVRTLHERGEWSGEDRGLHEDERLEGRPTVVSLETVSHDEGAGNFLKRDGIVRRMNNEGGWAQVGGKLTLRMLRRNDPLRQADEVSTSKSTVIQ
jgi:hypothetical protein